MQLSPCLDYHAVTEAITSLALQHKDIMTRKENNLANSTFLQIATLKCNYSVVLISHRISVWLFFTQGHSPKPAAAIHRCSAATAPSTFMVNSSQQSRRCAAFTLFLTWA